MADFSADSSVLVKRHASETGSACIRALVDPAAGHVVITARVSLVEVYSAFARRMREAQPSLADYRDLAADFAGRCANEYGMIDLVDAVVERARSLVERHPLRAYDAVQLASALTASDALREAGLPPLTFLSAHDRLLEAAQTEGLVTDNPNAHA